MKSTLILTAVLILSSVASAQVKPPREQAIDRFLRYAKIDTQSKEDQTTVPSTRKQFDLANLLAKELKELGAQNVRVSEYAIVYATIPGNLTDNSKVPVIGFIAHMDTSPAVSGQNVNAIIHKDYRGGTSCCQKILRRLSPSQRIPASKSSSATISSLPMERLCLDPTIRQDAQR
jgi:di/tripeptidase